MKRKRNNLRKKIIISVIFILTISCGLPNDSALGSPFVSSPIKRNNEKTATIRNKQLDPKFGTESAYPVFFFGYDFVYRILNLRNQTDRNLLGLTGVENRITDLSINYSSYSLALESNVKQEISNLYDLTFNSNPSSTSKYFRFYPSKDEIKNNKPYFKRLTLDATYKQLEFDLYFDFSLTQDSLPFIQWTEPNAGSKTIKYYFSRMINDAGTYKERSFNSSSFSLSNFEKTDQDIYQKNIIETQQVQDYDYVYIAVFVIPYGKDTAKLKTIYGNFVLLGIIEQQIIFNSSNI